MQFVISNLFSYQLIKQHAFLDSVSTFRMRQIVFSSNAHKQIPQIISRCFYFKFTINHLKSICLFWSNKRHKGQKRSPKKQFLAEHKLWGIVYEYIEIKIYINISILRKGKSFICKKNVLYNFFYQSMICARFGWMWTSRSEKIFTSCQCIFITLLLSPLENGRGPFFF